MMLPLDRSKFGVDIFRDVSFTDTSVTNIFKKTGFRVEDSDDFARRPLSFDHRFVPRIILSSTSRGVVEVAMASGSTLVIPNFRTNTATVIEPKNGVISTSEVVLDVEPRRHPYSRGLSPKSRSVVDLVALLLSAERTALEAPSPKVLNLGISYFEEILRELTSDIGRLHKFTPRGFEEFIAELLSRDGFEVELTNQTRDNGVDILAHKHERFGRVTYAYECKKYREDRPVGVRLVRELASATIDNGAVLGVLCTTSYFSREALDLAQRTQIIYPQNILSIHKWIMESSVKSA